MTNRLLYFSGLLCLLIAEAATAQQLKTVAETSEFTDYEITNNDLRISAPYYLIAPVKNGAVRFQVLEQSVAETNTTVSRGKITALELSGSQVPLVQVSKSGFYRGEEVAPIAIHITRHGNQGSKILRRIKIRVYKTGLTQIETPRSADKVFADHKLANGEWYKIPVRKKGIYQIDSDYLSELGISLETVDPRNLQIWGTPGDMLPESNDEPRPEFSQIPIIVTGESDGSFGSNDRIIFYGSSTHKEFYNNEGLSHQTHYYSNENYVFLHLGNNRGERLTPENNNSSNASRTVTTFRDFIWKEEELTKVEDDLKSGRQWLGQRLGTGLNNTFASVLRDTLPGIVESEPVHFSAQLVGRSIRDLSADTRINNTSSSSVNFTSIGEYNNSTGLAGDEISFTDLVNTTFTDGIIDVSVRMNNNGETNAVVFIDWLNLKLTRQLTARDNYLFFYSPENGSGNEIARYSLSGFSEQPYVLDVTNPVEPKLLSVNSSGSQYTFNYYSGDYLSFIAQSDLYTPGEGEVVENQNLRGATVYPDYIIITSESLKEFADELAQYRSEEGFTPLVVTQEQILNEFSGGVLDPVALRDFVKYLWDRAAAEGERMPRHLLLFGDTTYDYKNIVDKNFSNHVVTYESLESIDRVRTFGTDDFFAFLDDNEGDLTRGSTSNLALLDIGVGRITAQTRSDAALAVEKIKSYESPENTGDWQNIFTFAGDDDLPQNDEDLHTYNADETAARMSINEPGIRINKVYEFAYPEEITGAGRQIPGATKAFINAFNNGSLVINYSGHGDNRVLTDEELFRSEQIPQLTNKNKLAVLATATCQFGRYDDIDIQSGAEQLFLAENGGVIASFTTTRVVYTGSSINTSNNFGLNIALSQAMLSQNNDGSPLRLGDIYVKTKNRHFGNSPMVSTINSKKFILIGDPALRFRIPQQRAAVTSINNTPVQDIDTIKIRALDQVNLTGQVMDRDSTFLPNYSGETTLTVFDAKRTVSLPQRDWVLEGNCDLDNCSYEVESDVLFKGKVAVTDGIFNSTFIVPKDINFSDKTGRIVIFANSNGTTAGGSFTDISFNGINPAADSLDDGNGPQLDVYLNDERFVNGNLVNSSPTLIVELEDQSGINTAGTGIGHEIIATIDTQPNSQSYVLNDFYEGNLNDYTRGRIEYPLDQLPEGNYTLKVRAWDVHNNPSEKEIFFEVASENQLDVRSVYNYPNPMNNMTNFTFEHNQPGNPLDVSIRIFTLSGKPVQNIKESILTTSSYASISWNGRDRDYDRLGNGTYIYVLRVAANTPAGRQSTEKVEKLVIIR